MKTNSIENPFSACTARDMEYIDVMNFWCDPYIVYGLDEQELYSSSTPIIIEGVRGTGKTMILKHLSYFVQKDKIKSDSVQDILNHFKRTGIGVYYRYKGDFCNMFEDIGAEDRDVQMLFRLYYELYISREMVRVLVDIYPENEMGKIQKQVSESIGFQKITFRNLYKEINRCIREIDDQINVLLYVGDIKDTISKYIRYQNLFYKLVDCIVENMPGWKDIQIHVLLDEYENAWRFHRSINTMIKQVDSERPLTYRIGMRPAGMSNHKTLIGDNESLQEDRDYLLRVLTAKKKKDYEEFVLEIAARRLERVDTYKKEGLTDLRRILGARENIDQEAKEVAKDDRHFKLMKNKFENEEEYNSAVLQLSTDDKLMEMYNILRVRRGDDYREIAEISSKYRKAKETKQLKKLNDDKLTKYKNDYSSKYRMALLFLLLSMYVGEEKKYYSVKTYIYLSSGSVNDFISLCRNAFNYIDDEEFENIKKGFFLSKDIQTIAAKKTAESQMRKITMSNRYGFEIHNFIENMGRLFEFYHKDRDIKYPETNQFSFENEAEIYDDSNTRKYITELLNDGVAIRDENLHRISIGEKRGVVYKFNRIFAPIYHYSYRTRGGYNHLFDKKEFLQILRESIDPKKIAGKKPSSVKWDDMDQISIEDYLNGKNVF